MKLSTMKTYLVCLTTVKGTNAHSRADQWHNMHIFDTFFYQTISRNHRSTDDISNEKLNSLAVELFIELATDGGIFLDRFVGDGLEFVDVRLQFGFESIGRIKTDVGRTWNVRSRCRR